MAFERFNQSFKRMAEICNFRDVAKSMGTFWSMASAIELISGKASAWGVDVLNVAVEHSHPDEISRMLASDAFLRKAAPIAVPGPPLCFRELVSRTLGSHTLAVNEWVMVMLADGVEHIVVVQRLVHVQDLTSASIVMLANRWDTPVRRESGDGGVIRVPISSYNHAAFTPVCLSEAALLQWEPLHMSTVGDELMFRAL